MARRILGQSSGSSGGGGGGGGGSLTSTFVKTLEEVSSTTFDFQQAFSQRNRSVVSQYDDNSFMVLSLGESASNVLVQAVPVSVDNSGTATVLTTNTNNNSSGTSISTTMYGEIGPGIPGFVGWIHWTSGTYEMCHGWVRWNRSSTPSVHFASLGASRGDSARYLQGQTIIGLGTATGSTGNPQFSYSGYTVPGYDAGHSFVDNGSGYGVTPGSYSSTNYSTPAIKHFSDTGKRCGIHIDHRNPSNNFGYYEAYGNALSTNLGYTAATQQTGHSKLIGYCWKDTVGSSDRAFYYDVDSGMGFATDRNGSVVADGFQIPFHPEMEGGDLTTTDSFQSVSEGTPYKNFFPVGLNTYWFNGVIAKLHFNTSTGEGHWETLGKISRQLAYPTNQKQYRVAGNNKQYLVEFAYQANKITVYDLASEIDLSAI